MTDLDKTQSQLKLLCKKVAALTLVSAQQHGYIQEFDQTMGALVNAYEDNIKEIIDESNTLVESYRQRDKNEITMQEKIRQFNSLLKSEQKMYQMKFEIYEKTVLMQQEELNEKIKNYQTIDKQLIDLRTNYQYLIDLFKNKKEKYKNNNNHLKNQVEVLKDNYQNLQYQSQKEIAELKQQLEESRESDQNSINEVKDLQKQTAQLIQNNRQLKFANQDLISNEKIRLQKYEKEIFMKFDKRIRQTENDLTLQIKETGIKQKMVELQTKKFIEFEEHTKKNQDFQQNIVNEQIMEIHRLTKELNDLHTQIQEEKDERQKQINELNKNVSYVLEQQSNKENSFLDLHKNFLKLTQQYKSLQVTIEEYKLYEKKYQKNIKVMEDSITEYLSIISNLEEKNQQLDKRVSFEKQSYETLNLAFEKYKYNTQNEIQQYKQEIDLITQDMGDAITLKKTSIEKDQQIANQQKKLIELNAFLQNMNNQIAKITETTQKQTSALTQEKNALETSLRQQQQDLQNNLVKVQKLQKQNQEYLEEIQKLNKQMQQVEEGTKSAQKENLNKIQQQKDEIKEIQNKVSQLNDQINALNETLKNKDSKISSQEVNIQSLNQTIDKENKTIVKILFFLIQQKSLQINIASKNEIVKSIQGDHQQLFDVYQRELDDKLAAAYQQGMDGLDQYKKHCEITAISYENKYNQLMDRYNELQKTILNGPSKEEDIKLIGLLKKEVKQNTDLSLKIQERHQLMQNQQQLQSKFGGKQPVQNDLMPVKKMDSNNFIENNQNQEKDEKKKTILLNQKLGPQQKAKENEKNMKKALKKLTKQYSRDDSDDEFNV